MSLLNERFSDVVQIAAQGMTQYSEDAAAEEFITEMAHRVPEQPPSGLGYRIKIFGTRATGTNGTLVVKIYLNSTAVLTLTADANASGDWFAEAVILFKRPNVQKCFGEISQITQDQMVDYAGATVDCTNGAAIRASFTQGHADDATTVEFWTIEKWIVPLVGD